MKLLFCFVIFLLGIHAYILLDEMHPKHRLVKRQEEDDKVYDAERPLTEEDFENAKSIVSTALDPHAPNPRLNLGAPWLFEGDIDGVYQLKDTAWNGKIPPLWSNGTVPYVISNNFNSTERALIDKAMLELHHKTCIRFVPRKSEKDYVEITKNTGIVSTDLHPCRSHVGRKGGLQFIVMAAKCFIYNNLLQQMMHTLGFLLEHRRPDRDTFVYIKWENVYPSLSSFDEFTKYPKEMDTTFSKAYDYESVMHVPHDAYTKKKGFRTIIPREKHYYIKQGKSFSEGDLQRIDQLYNCKIYPYF